MTEQLDPSSVLAYLNEMGYYNISTYQLKEFLKDLRKLMKYEEKINFQSDINNHTRTVLEKANNLFATQTISSRAKTTQKCPEANIEKITKNGEKSSKKNIQGKKLNDCKSNAETLKNIPQNFLEKKPPACITNIPTNQRIVRECHSAKSTTTKKSNVRTTASSKSTNARFETDPVTLYHQYKKEWERKKIPGENPHADLRWKVRQKICQL